MVRGCKFVFQGVQNNFFFLILYVGSGFEYFYCYVNKLKPNRPNTINFVENGFKNWALVRIATTGHDRK